MSIHVLIYGCTEHKPLCILALRELEFWENVTFKVTIYVLGKGKTIGLLGMKFTRTYEVTEFIEFNIEMSVEEILPEPENYQSIQ